MISGRSSIRWATPIISIVNWFEFLSFFPILKFSPNINVAVSSHVIGLIQKSIDQLSKPRSSVSHSINELIAISSDPDLSILLLKNIDELPSNGTIWSRSLALTWIGLL